MTPYIWTGFIFGTAAGFALFGFLNAITVWLHQ